MYHSLFSNINYATFAAYVHPLFYVGSQAFWSTPKFEISMNRPRLTTEITPPNPVQGGEDVFAVYDYKRSRRAMRGTLVLLSLLLLSFYPLWLTFINARLTYELTITLNIVLVLSLSVSAVRCLGAMRRMSKIQDQPYAQIPRRTNHDNVSHIVIIAAFDEPIELLLETIATIAAQTVASSIIMVIGMEETTLNRESKKYAIIDHFGNSFKGLTFVIHPYLVHGEIPGVSAGRNYAARAAVDFMLQNGMLTVDPESNEVDANFITVTVCDPDTTFLNLYFANLEQAFLSESEDWRYHLFWQSPLFYCTALENQRFFTRVMGVLRSFFIVGFLVGNNISTSNVYSTSLRLLLRSKFFHPRYQFDNMMVTSCAMNMDDKLIRIRLLDVPTLVTPALGSTVYDEFLEWMTHVRSYTTGVAEAFHYCLGKILKGNHVLVRLPYFMGFLYFHMFVLSFFGIVQTSTLFVQLIGIKSHHVSIGVGKPFGSLLNLPVGFPYQILLPFLVLITYVIIYSTAFFMEYVALHAFQRSRRIGPIRTIFQYSMCQIVLWTYCFITFTTIASISIFGKQVFGYIDLSRLRNLDNSFKNLKKNTFRKQNSFSSTSSYSTFTTMDSYGEIISDETEEFQYENFMPMSFSESNVSSLHELESEETHVVGDLKNENVSSLLKMESSDTYQCVQEVQKSNEDHSVLVRGSSLQKISTTFNLPTFPFQKTNESLESQTKYKRNSIYTRSETEILERNEAIHDTQAMESGFSCIIDSDYSSDSNPGSVNDRTISETISENLKSTATSHSRSTFQKCSFENVLRAAQKNMCSYPRKTNSAELKIDSPSFSLEDIEADTNQDCAQINAMRSYGQNSASNEDSGELPNAARNGLSLNEINTSISNNLISKSSSSSDRQQRNMQSNHFVSYEETQNIRSSTQMVSYELYHIVFAKAMRFFKSLEDQGSH